MPIQLLPPQLANQIAAGEVVERPASVIKELVENSLDAGATQIEIDVEKGGSKLIRVRDNGSGIAEHELMLALSRHATSKISTLTDLEQIVSLGFRGEALASISSVARLTLTSKPSTQATAWQASAEGRDMAVQVRPAAHPDGTSIEVLDLFFNTPARRRFLRSDKTEFSHIDELIKRLALSRFDVSWLLTHNGQIVRRLAIADSPAAKQKRLATLCGRNFASQALWIENQYGPIRLSGWLLAPHACQQVSACQYSYVNGRMMRDKLLNHAIRQAYGERLHAEQQPAFVLYLELDAADVDVNVHPAKHEVRFHQARLVHDFVVSALTDALNQASANALDYPEHLALSAQELSTEDSAPQAVDAATAKVTSTLTSAEHYSSYRPANTSLPKTYTAEPQQASAYTPVSTREQALSSHAVQAQVSYTQSSVQDAATVLPVATPTYLLLHNRFALCQLHQQLMLVDIAASSAKCWQQQVQSAALLLPLRLPLNAKELPVLLSYAKPLEVLGFDLLIRDNTAIVRAVPIWLRHTAISQWFGRFISEIQQQPKADIAHILLELLLSANYLQAELLLNYYPQAISEAHWCARPLTLDEQALQLQVLHDVN